MRQGYQQGDVLFTQIQKLPRKLTLRQPDGGRYVLVEGEGTGHAHTVNPSKDIKVYVTEEGRQYLQVLNDSSIVYHDTHHPQCLTRGIYEITQVVEIDPFAEEIRAVKD